MGQNCGGGRRGQAQLNETLGYPRNAERVDVRHLVSAMRVSIVMDFVVIAFGKNGTC